MVFSGRGLQKGSKVAMARVPEITVVMPVFNGQRYLAESIEAILAQSFTDFELVVVDDCSTDASPDIMREYASRDSRIRILRNDTNKKLPASLNFGHREGCGKYFTWTSDDNNPGQEWLQTLHAVLYKNDVDIVFSNYIYINDCGEMTGRTTAPRKLSHLLWENTVGASFMYTRSAYERLGGYDERLFLVEDYDFWVRAYTSGMTFIEIDDYLYDYRQHGAALSASIPQDNISISYRLGIRKKFRNATPDEIFKSRTTLLYNGKGMLPISALLLLFLEAAWACPWLTLRTLLVRGVEFLKR